MNKVKAFYNRNFKFLMLLFSINPIVNIILDNKKKEVLQNNFNQLGFILTIVISLVFIYYYNNLERVKRINTEKSSFVVFAIFSLICSIFKYTFIETLIISLEGTLVFFVLMTVFINKIENKVKRIKIVESKDICKEEEKLYDSRKPSKDRILEILRNKDNKASLILVDGEWGIGKTFFMDKVLDEGKNILPVKVDVLLFNEKKQMINFVMEEIHKILLDKGIRSTSIRKYLSVINDGIDNKFINGLYSLFSDDRAENIENDIKEDIKALKDEKLVVIVDNLERTLDKKITIDILGFLHYIYEKLGVNVVVLADETKLKNEINEKNYLQKFFDYRCELREIEYLKITGFLYQKKEIVFNENIKIQNSMKVFPKLYEDSLKAHNAYTKGVNINSITTFNIEDEMNKIENDMYNLIQKFSIPRTYEKVYSIFNTLVNEIKYTYGFSDEEIENFTEIILRMAFYKYIFGDKFKLEKLKKENPVRYQLLYGDYKKSQRDFETKTRTPLEMSIINTLNYHTNDIMNSIEMISVLDTSKDINELLKYFQIYYSTMYNLKNNKKKLTNFFKIIKTKIEEEYKEIDFFQENFNGLIVIDLYNYVAGEYSMIKNLLVHSRISNNMLTNSLSEVFNYTINEILGIDNLGDVVYANYGLHEIHKKTWRFLENENMLHKDEKKIFIETLHKKMENSNLNKLEKAKMEYFISAYNTYISTGKIIWLKSNEALKKIEEIETNITKYNTKIANTNLSLEGQWEIEDLVYKIKTQKDEIRGVEVELMKSDNYIINNSDELLNIIDFVKSRFEKCKLNLLDFNYKNNKKIYDYYKEFVDKGFKPDEEFEEILKKANIDIFKNEENHDL